LDLEISSNRCEIAVLEKIEDFHKIKVQDFNGKVSHEIIVEIDGN
jgi:hypothetical protein